MRFGRRHAHLQGGVIQRAWADPAQAFLNRVQDGKKQVAFRTRLEAVGTGVAIRPNQRIPFAWGGFKVFERSINSSLLLETCFILGQVQVQWSSPGISRSESPSP